MGEGEEDEASAAFMRDFHLGRPTVSGITMECRLIL
jgi:hypothetical protein